MIEFARVLMFWYKNEKTELASPDPWKSTVEVLIKAPEIGADIVPDTGAPVSLMIVILVPVAVLPAISVADILMTLAPSGALTDTGILNPVLEAIPVYVIPAMVTLTVAPEEAVPMTVTLDPETYVPDTGAVMTGVAVAVMTV